MSDFDPDSFREVSHPPLPPESMGPTEEPRLSIELEDGRTVFRPGETVTGVVRWDLDEEATDVVLRLFWFTEGRGTRDVEVAAEKRFEAPGMEDRRSFELRLPDGPYSFSGKLISLIWALELIADPGDRTTRRMLTVGPDRHEVMLGSVSGEGED